MTDTLVGRLQEALKQWWSFDDRQRHTHSWHTRTDFIYTELPKLVAPFEAEIERLTRDMHLMGMERDRIARNRDMWKDQCERQSAQLTELHAAESSLSEAVKAAYEDAAKIAEAKAVEFLSPEYATGQPFSSFNERFACEQVASAIRSRAAVLEQK